MSSQEQRKVEKLAKPQVYKGGMMRFPLALQMVSKLSLYGSLKYGVKPHEIAGHIVGDDKYGHLTESLVRHLLEEAQGHPINWSDGGMLHAANVAWNALARLQVYLENHPEEMEWNPEEAWEKQQQPKTDQTGVI